MRTNRVGRNERNPRGGGPSGGGGGGGASLPDASAPPTYVATGAGTVNQLTIPWASVTGSAGDVLIGTVQFEGGTASVNDTITLTGTDVADCEILWDSGNYNTNRRTMTFKAYQAGAGVPDQAFSLGGNTASLYIIGVHQFRACQYADIQVVGNADGVLTPPTTGDGGYTLGVEATPIWTPPSNTFPANYGYTIGYGCTDDGAPVATDSHTAIGGASSTSGSDIAAGQLSVADIDTTGQQRRFNYADMTNGVNSGGISPVIAIPGAA